MKKGRMAGVTGRIQIRTWENEEGKRSRATEVVADNVVFLDKKIDDIAVDTAGPDGFVGKSEKRDLPTSSTGPWISLARCSTYPQYRTAFCYCFLYIFIYFFPGGWDVCC
ncbi:MAG: single-strand DNA-binding protein [Thermoanaerobacteraceae bacterium]|nr:single-strand DNA-binding protein [Thermoanaerobacteraceae bacterium]